MNKEEFLATLTPDQKSKYGNHIDAVLGKEPEVTIDSSEYIEEMDD